MARRQQRTSNARGKLQVQNQVIAAQMDWTITAAAAATATINFVAPAGAIILKGVPRMICNENGQYATSAAWADPDLTITFGADLPALFTLTIDQYDPTVRTQNGAYIAAGTRQFPMDLPENVLLITADGYLNDGVNVADNDSVTSVNLQPGVEGERITFVIPSIIGADIEVTGTGYDAPQAPGTIETYVFTGGIWVQL